MRRVGEGKKLRYDDSSMRYFLEKVVDFKPSLERQLRNFSNPLSNSSTFVGKFVENGYMLFTADRKVIFWRFDPILEYCMNSHVLVTANELVSRIVANGQFRFLPTSFH